jgi:hypothetical protein
LHSIVDAGGRPRGLSHAVGSVSQTAGREKNARFGAGAGFCARSRYLVVANSRRGTRRYDPSADRSGVSAALISPKAALNACSISKFVVSSKCASSALRKGAADLS